MLDIVKSIYDRFFRRTQQVRDGTVNAPDAGSNPAAEANSTPWSGGWVPDTYYKRTKTTVFDKDNTIVLTNKSEETSVSLTKAQLKAIRLDDLRDTIKINAARSSIYRHNTHKPQQNVKKRCRKLVDAANACTEKAPDGKKFKIKEGKLEEYRKHMADAKELAKTLRSRQTRPFNSTLHYKRTITVRKEQRASYIAYGFVKGKRYSQVEDNPRWKRFDRGECGHGVKPDWIKVTSILLEVYGITTDQGNIFELRKQLSDKLEVWKGN